jgi:hypothetical protein
LTASADDQDFLCHSVQRKQRTDKRANQPVKGTGR